MLNKTGLQWLKLLDGLITHAGIVQSREGETLERLNASIVYPMDSWNINIPERKLNTHFIVEEAMFAFSGQVLLNDTELETAKSILKPWVNERGIYSGAYGPQIQGQLDYILEILSSLPETRQAVMTIWKENPRPQLNVPCLTQLHFLLRGGALNCFATMRSSDAWLGLPNDMGVFSMITLIIANKLGYQPGTMYINMHSSHLYRKDEEKAYALVELYREELSNEN